MRLARILKRPKAQIGVEFPAVVEVIVAIITKGRHCTLSKLKAAGLIAQSIGT